MRPQQWPIRVRLTVLYGGLFFLAGAVLLVVTYLLVKQSLDARQFRVGNNLAVERVPDIVNSRVGRDVLVRLQEDLRREQDAFKAGTLESLLTRGGLALGLVGIVAAGFGWLVAGRALQPLHRITETAGRIAMADGAGGGLHERIAIHGPRDEITELANTFDAMLERLDRSFDSQRRLVANASHELRTPLAINRALIELAITKPGASADTRQLGESLLAINARHERLIDGLLTLADSENGIGERSAVNLADVAAHVVQQVDTAGVGVTTDLNTAPTTGDPVLLERLVQNLVENAVRHNVPGGWLHVGTRAVDGRAELMVSNTGPVVAPYEVDTIFQPFRRLAGDRVGPDRGFGLGLSIVAAVSRAHGGRTVAAPREGGGLIVTVTLPASAR
jgi:signal transduction histidine kinase